jgi:nucleoside phosphorylase
MATPQVSQPHNPQSTDALHPARLLVSAAVSEAEFAKKFRPVIKNTPDLPIVNWAAVGGAAPVLLETPASLPKADAVVITWAESEWAALQHVFCSSGTAMTYSKRNEGAWTGWVKYSAGAPASLGYWGYFRLVQIGGKDVLLFKSNTHYAASQGEQNLEALTNLLIQKVAPTVILSVGTAGGARDTDPVGIVNVVRVDALYESNQPQSAWPSYSTTWAPNWAMLSNAHFNSLLFAVPTTQDDIAGIIKQFNEFYKTTYSLSTLDPLNLNFGNVAHNAAKPVINDMTTAGSKLLTAKSFVVANTSGNLSTFACVEMDDAVIAKAAAAGGTLFGSIRNISDPIQNVALTPTFQGHWGEAIYTAYGMYTSFNGAMATWAVLS